MRSFAESDIGRVYGHSPKKKQILDDCDSPTRLHRFREILHATALVFFFVDVALSHRVTAVAFSGGTKEEPCPRKGHSEEQIVYALRQVEGGTKVSERTAPSAARPFPNRN
jgi:hypothetical protein